MSNFLACPSSFQRSSLPGILTALRLGLLALINTASILAHSVKEVLPRATSTPTNDKPQTLQVGFDAFNRVFGSSGAVDRDSLATRFPDAVARRAGLESIGFIGQPGSE